MTSTEPDPATPPGDEGTSTAGATTATPSDLLGQLTAMTARMWGLTAPAGTTAAAAGSPAAPIAPVSPRSARCRRSR